MTTRPVRDFDFHPDEDHVRVFTCRPDGVPRLSGGVSVSAARYGGIVLWHYTFARHWFKVNLTTDLAGQIVETGDAQSGRFAFNCDIATRMRRRGDAVLAVDLFADVLVRADSLTYPGPFRWLHADVRFGLRRLCRSPPRGCVPEPVRTRGISLDAATSESSAFCCDGLRGAHVPGRDRAPR